MALSQSEFRNNEPPQDTFARLQGAGELEYIHVDAVPRSMSTIVPIALCEAGVVDPTRQYVQCDEPFNWRTRNKGFAAVAPALVTLALGDKRPTTIFEKSTARNIYPPTFGDICDVAKGIVFTLRHPEKQMYSLAQRIANDLAHGKGAGNKVILSNLSSDEYRTALLGVDEFFAISGHHDGVWPAGERPYMQPSWREIGENFRQANAKDTPVAVVDGTSLTQHPEQTFKMLCKTLEIPYSPTMVAGWSAVGNELNKDHTNWPSAKTNNGGFANSWIERATHTKGIEEDTTPSIILGNCPPRMRQYIEDVALPTYAEMAAHPNSNVKLHLDN